MTVEPNLKHWHYTIMRGGQKEVQRLPNNQLHKIQDNFYYWFGLSVDKCSRFELLKGTNELMFSVSPGNSQVYLDYLSFAHENARHNVVEQSTEDVGESEFIHFDVLIDCRLNRESEEMPLTFSLPPEQTSVRLDSYGTLDQFPTRIHEVKVVDFPGNVVIAASKHVGSLGHEGVIIKGWSAN